MAASPGILHAVAGWTDGRHFCNAVRDGKRTQSPPRITAISSSLLALSESFARETLAGRASYSSISTDLGSIVIVRVPSRTQSLALCLAVDKSESFAMALRFALDTAAEMATVVDHRP